jgi:hypothetical protein
LLVFPYNRLLHRLAGVCGLQATLNESLQDSLEPWLRGINDDF